MGTYPRERDMLDAYIINSIRDADDEREPTHVVLEIDPPARDEPELGEAEEVERGPIVIPLRDDDDDAEEDDAA
jgi:hypothetical protein